MKQGAHMAENTLDTAFGELLHLNLLEEFKAYGGAWTRERLAKAYENALTNTMLDGAPEPAEGSLEAAILGLGPKCETPSARPRRSA
ncbi:hypothetical protein [Lichenifustis flavocetrariae]|uniref:Uncharacterized protein n=1 Tax=Lichenifustis flavocetrariae TaxID=2949735 RepID=A0AA42CNZ7_9HYPH|nr:hypothetical protein [Lichenifustis flavocetrariae]MCW6509905.1 hypothetical protein [Lichenifustis flavocetrariae]